MVLLAAFGLASCAETDVETAVAALLADPASARFQALRDHGNHVCGEVNGRDERGVYRGYRRFVYDEGAGMALIDPQVALDMAGVDHAGPACRKPASYQSVDERLACADAPRLRGEQDRQRGFERLWNRMCS